MILRAIKEKRFLPVGADKEAISDFQLIGGTSRDLSVDVVLDGDTHLWDDGVYGLSPDASRTSASAASPASSI